MDIKLPGNISPAKNSYSVNSGYPANLSIPITINIGNVQPSAPTASSKLALALLGTSIASFLNSPKGKEVDDMIGVEADISSPPLSNYSRSDINNAIQKIGEETAAELALTLVPKIIAKLGDKPPTPKGPTETNPDTNPTNPTTNPTNPETDTTKSAITAAGKELIDYVVTTVDEQLFSFYTPDDPKVQNLVQKGASIAEDLAKKFQISQDLVPKLAQIGLYDMIILCDDSGSMTGENRIAATKDAIVRFFQIATAVDTANGISVVCFDNANLQNMDNITDEADLRTKLDQIVFNTGYGVPGPLGLKIFNPLTKKASNQQLTNPVIVVVITDGGASAEEATSMAATIKVFNASLQANGYQGPSVKTLLCKVGTDPAAEAFLTLLEGDAEIKDSLLVCKDNLADKMVNNTEKYTGELVELLAKVISLGSGPIQMEL